MSSLTEIAIATKKLAFWSIFVFIGYLFLRSSFSIGVKYWKETHPTPTPTPDMRFGKLPPLIFPTDVTSSKGYQFLLQNIEGRPPETTASGKVYSLPKKLPTLLTSQKAKTFAQSLKFTAEPEIITSVNYKFTDPTDPLRTLELDTVNQNFKLFYDYKKNTKVISEETIINKDQALKEILSFLQTNHLFDESLLKGTTEIELLKYANQTQIFTPATSLSSTNIVRVNFFREDLNGLKILPPGFKHSPNYVLYTSSLLPNSNILEVSYNFWPIALDDYSYYPLKKSTAAWQELVNGTGYIVNIGKNSPQKPIVIRNIYLAYYDSIEPQDYLQLIFVFEGDDDFVAYLPAISAE